MITEIIKTYNNNGYPAHNGISVKTVTNTTARRLEDRETVYAKGLDVTDWFLCRFDSHGNICNSDGIVVFPSRSGRYPAKRGDIGYFGDFRENYTSDPNDTKYNHLPSVHDDVYHNNTEE